MSDADDTQVAIKYTERDEERMRRIFDEFAKCMEREQFAKANKWMMKYLGEWASILRGDG